MLVGLLTVALTLACAGVGAEPPWLTDALKAAGEGGEIDPCDYKGWPYRALASLNHGMAEAPEAVDRALAQEPLLAPLAAHPLGKRWRASWQADLTSDVGLALFLNAHPDFTREQPALPPVSLSLQPDGTAQMRQLGRDRVRKGRWRVEGGVVLLDLGDGPTRLKPRRAPYYLVLDGDDATWAVDPVVCAG